MWRIKQFRSPLGHKEEAVSAGYLQRLIAGDHADVVKIIEDHIRAHDFHGRSDEQDSWWCRNKGDKENLVLVIEGEGGPET